MSPVLLDVRGVQTYYGKSQILFGVDIMIGAGEFVTLMGRNGMGKTTLVRSILGLTSPRFGSIVMEGHELKGLPVSRVAQHGIALVPEVRKVFSNLTVEEHFVIAQRTPSHGAPNWNLGRVLDLFPSLARRLRNLGSQLSGGEQQMLAIGTALISNPKLVILDEATEGLAPLLRKEIWRCLDLLKSAGQSVLVIDKNIDALSRLADRHFIIEKGHIVWSGSSADLETNSDLHHRYLGI
jgi:branched-chain amino acid transport system ATP-binding protein